MHKSELMLYLLSERDILDDSWLYKLIGMWLVTFGAGVPWVVTEVLRYHNMQPPLLGLVYEW